MGCPTWARNLAQVSVSLLGSRAQRTAASTRSGTWHYCDRDPVSWFDFARAIFTAALEAGLLERLPELTAVTSAQFPQAALRPLYSVLDTSAIQADFGVEPAGLHASLRACIEELKQHDEQH